jgi:hypothetical protein
MSRKPNIIRVNISDNGIHAKGYYFDHKGNHYGFNKQFQSELTMQVFFTGMRDADYDFLLVIERNRPYDVVGFH